MILWKLKIFRRNKLDACCDNQKRHHWDIVGRHLLIVNDIIDTGLTLKTICKMLEDKGAAPSKSPRLNKPEGRNVIGAEPKYIGTAIRNAVVGFACYQQKYRNFRISVF